MDKLKYRFIREGNLYDIYVPISVALVDYEDVKACGLTPREACERIAAQVDGPMAINVFDLNATSTTSDGVFTNGSMVCMAASDYGRINPEFGYIDMLEIPWSRYEELVQTEPHLIQWKMNYPGRRMLMGPAHKNIPVHSAALTGRAGNNNSATEMMHYINMEELLFLFHGQLECMRDGKVEIGGTGGIISVGIGMFVGEENGRIAQHKQFPTGTSAHKSGAYAQTLKAHIPVIAADKSVLAGHIIKALQTGIIPGRDFAASPAIMSVAKRMKIHIAVENMAPEALEELASVGFTKEWIEEEVPEMTPEEIIANAHEIIPGIDHPKTYNATDIFTVEYA